LNYKNRSRFLTDKIKLDGFDDKHVAEYYLDVLKLLDINPKSHPLEVYADEESRKWAQEFIERESLGNNLIVGLVPCGGEAFGKYDSIRRWPGEKFSLLIKSLVKEFGAKIFLFAGPKEKEEIHSIIYSLDDTRGSCYEFADASLLEIMALMEKCSLMIVNNTGPSRFADVLGKKVIALAGPVDETVYGPYPYESQRTIVIKKDLPCQPCYKRFRMSDCLLEKKCLTDISVDEVLQAANKLLKGK
jgi:heptosyltransferase-2